MGVFPLFATAHSRHRPHEGMAHQGPFLTPRLQSDRQDLHDIVMPSIGILSSLADCDAPVTCTDCNPPVTCTDCHPPISCTDCPPPISCADCRCRAPCGGHDDSTPLLALGRARSVDEHPGTFTTPPNLEHFIGWPWSLSLLGGCASSAFFGVALFFSFGSFWGLLKSCWPVALVPSIPPCSCLLQLLIVLAIPLWVFSLTQGQLRLAATALISSVLSVGEVHHIVPALVEFFNLHHSIDSPQADFQLVLEGTSSSR